MRKLFVILLFAFCAANTLFGSSRAYRVEDIPNVQAADRTRFVSNPDGLLSQSAVYRIDTMLYSLKESGRAQVVVVAVNSIGDEVPFDFLQQLVTRWGVGRKEADDGLGILLVVDQGAIEIQTGYGLEGDLPDALLKRIINNYMLPAFRERDWDRGMTEGVAAIAGVLNGTLRGRRRGDWHALLFLRRAASCYHYRPRVRRTLSALSQADAEACRYRGHLPDEE